MLAACGIAWARVDARDCGPQLEMSQFSYRNGIELPYHLREGKNEFLVDFDLPELKDALVIHFNLAGHPMIWYKNHRIDSEGRVFQSISNFTRPLRNLSEGVVFAVRKLPEDFERKFDDYIQNFSSCWSRTCVTSACKTVGQLGMGSLLDGESPLFPVRLTEILLEKASDPTNQIEIWSLGGELGSNLEKIRSFYRNRFIGLSVIMSLVALDLGGNALWRCMH